MASAEQRLHPAVRRALALPDTLSDADFASWWEQRANRVCKPCWELKYCPYGPLVEQSPLLPQTREDAVDHLEYIKGCLASGMAGHGEPLDDQTRQDFEDCVADFNPGDYEPDPTGEITMMQRLGRDIGDDLTREAAVAVNEDMKRALKTGIVGNLRPITDEQREHFQREIDEFDAADYPEEIPGWLIDASCNVFGHLCPAVFNAEQMTETSELRRTGRYISFKTKIRVVRRDNYTCQRCGKHLRDNEVEFDHEIPISKGGSSEEQNIRLTCFDCNRSKSDKVSI